MNALKATLLLVGLISLESCASGRPAGVFVPSSIRMRDVAERIMKVRPGRVVLELPMLCVYDKSGGLLYQGSDGKQNLDLLNRLPRVPRKLPPLPAPELQLPLRDVLPELDKLFQRSSGNKLVIVSVLSKTCVNGCQAQEDALRRLQPKLAAKGVSLLSIELAE